MVISFGRCLIFDFYVLRQISRISAFHYEEIMRLYFLWLIGGLFSLTACVQGQQKAQDQIHFTVLTYNIHHCNPPSKPDTIDVEAIARVMLEVQPDLVALQEVDVHTERSGKELDQAEALAALTNMYVYFKESIPYQGGSYGLAILSKFPILGSQGYDLPSLEGTNAEPRSLAMVTVELPNRQKLKFGCTHLDHSNAANNLLQAREITELYKDESLPLIIAGDFNAEPQSETIAHLDQYFTRTCQDSCAGTIPVQKPAKAIDFILYKPDTLLQVTQHKVIQETYASDHLPVMASFVIGSVE